MSLLAQLMYFSSNAIHNKSLLLLLLLLLLFVMCHSRNVSIYFWSQVCLLKVGFEGKYSKWEYTISPV